MINVTIILALLNVINITLMIGTKNFVVVLSIVKQLMQEFLFKKSKSFELRF